MARNEHLEGKELAVLVEAWTGTFLALSAKLCAARHVWAAMYALRTAIDVAAEYEQQEILKFYEMLHRRGRPNPDGGGGSLTCSLTEFDTMWAYAQITSPVQERLRVILGAARRAGWRPPEA